MAWMKARSDEEAWPQRSRAGKVAARSSARSYLWYAKLRSTSGYSTVSFGPVDGRRGSLLDGCMPGI